MARPISMSSCSALAAILIDYAAYVRILRWLTLALLAYAGTALADPVSWGSVIAALALPPIELTSV